MQAECKQNASTNADAVRTRLTRIAVDIVPPLEHQQRTVPTTRKSENQSRERIEPRIADLKPPQEIARRTVVPSLWTAPAPAHAPC